MNKNPISIIIGAVLLVVFLVLLFVFQVRQSEVAIVTTFSKSSGESIGPGAHFRLPWPIQKVITFDQRVQSYEGKITESQTADTFSLLTQIYVGWRISDPKQFFLKFAGGSTLRAEERLDEMLLSAKRDVVGKHPIRDFVSADGTNKFVVVEEEILKAVQAQLKANNYGLEVQFVGFKKLGIPENVTPSVFELMKSGRDKLARAYESQGQQEADIIKATANSEASKKLAAAESEAQSIRAQGEKAAAEVYPTFQQNPELAIFLLQLQAMETSLKDRSTLVFDASTPPFNLLRGGASTNLLKK